MRLLERLFTRRRTVRRFSDITPRIRVRLKIANRELAEAEDAIARQLGLSKPPRLLMVDEEKAIVIFPEDRRELS